MHRSGVIAVADLRGSCHDVALVDTMLAGGAVVPAVVPDVEVSAKPGVVFGLGALNSLVVQRAGADPDSHASTAFTSAFFSFAAFAAFAAALFSFAAFAATFVSPLPSSSSLPGTGRRDVRCGRC